MSALVLGVGGLVAGCASGSRASDEREQAEARWALALHGGAGTIEPTDPPEQAAAYRAALTAALTRGLDMLAGGASALDTCEAVVRMMEDDPLFNAGRGGALNERGEAELDAAIMDGSTLRCGAVAGTKVAKNPITLARRVMEQTRHVLIAGEGTDDFARSAGVEIVPNEYFVTPRRRQMLDEELAKRTGRVSALHTTPSPARMGTVGVVALDQAGRLAAATSTGGLTGKKPGRVGDTPLVGAGTLADDMVAVSCTGTGEQFIRHRVAAGVSSRVHLLPESVVQAADHYVFKVLEPDDGGLIAIDRRGTIAMPFSSIGMYRGAATSDGRFEVKIWKE